jgi:phosphomannomutase
VYYIGVGFARWLKSKRGDASSAPKVSIGTDPRLSSDLVSAALAAGLASEKVKVVQFGICTTPAMFMSCVLEKHKCDSAAMVTASHLPRNRVRLPSSFTPIADGSLSWGLSSRRFGRTDSLPLHRRAASEWY